MIAESAAVQVRSNPNLRFNPPPASLFQRNRAKFTARMQPGTAAVVYAAPLVVTNADAHFPFQQDTNFYYLTGIQQEDAILWLFPDAPRAELREVLFITRTNPQIQLWTGWKYSLAEAAEASGVTTVRYLDEFDAVLRQMLHRVDGFYLDINEHDRNVLYRATPAHAFAHRVQREFPAHRLLRANPVLAELRLHKEPEELAQTREAIRITEQAFRRILQFVRPGVREYEVEAEILHEFIRNGASGPAYSSIVASGANANVLHYINNSRECLAGDLLLMDFGASYGNYAADLTRTIPVNGRFSDRQRQVYQAVHRVKDYATSLLRPGTTMPDYVKAVDRFMQDELLALGVLQQADMVSEPRPDAPYKQFFPHGISHPLGLDVHDVGTRYATFAPGHVYTVEPGIYLPQEGFGVRIENNVLITETGPEDLMASIPSDPDEIERLMQ